MSAGHPVMCSPDELRTLFLFDVTLAAEPGELVVGELLEQEQLAQLIRSADRRRPGAHVRSR